ncbi:N-acetylglucosamine-induced protein 1 [Diutina catenulata]
MLRIDTGLVTPPSSSRSSPVSNKTVVLHKTTRASPSPELYKAFGITSFQSPLMPGNSKVKEVPFTWDQIRYIIAANDLDLFARSPQETEHYLKFKAHLKSQGTSIQDYLVEHELQWQHIQPSDHPLFGDVTDIKVMYNKFPYYFPDDVTHLCVWTKVPIPDDPTNPDGDISPATRRLIDTFIRKIFKGSDLVWFRNWTALQSVRAISHCHVIVRNIDPALLKSLLAGDFEALTPADYASLA